MSLHYVASRYVTLVPYITLRSVSIMYFATLRFVTLCFVALCGVKFGCAVFRFAEFVLRFVTSSYVFVMARFVMLCCVTSGHLDLRISPLVVA